MIVPTQFERYGPFIYVNSRIVTVSEWKYSAVILCPKLPIHGLFTAVKVPFATMTVNESVLIDLGIYHFIIRVKPNKSQ